MKTLRTSWIGTIPYEEALELQTRLVAERGDGRVGDTLLLLEHPHVYTIGRRGSAADVLWDEQALRDRGVEVVETDRGGQVTYHGPGQLVGYAICDLGRAADLVAYLRRLERAIISTLGGYGITATCVAGSTGVWVGRAKIAAIGVRVTKGITKHGFAINVSPDLSYFAGIVPCGITDRGVTSLGAELVSAPTVREVAGAFERAFRAEFGYSLLEGATA